MKLTTKPDSNSKPDSKRKNYLDSETDFVVDLAIELKRKFKILDEEVKNGTLEDYKLDEDQIKKEDIKTQILYNVLFGIVLELQKEMEGDKDIQAIKDAITDYENNVIDDIRGSYFNYLYSTDTDLIY